MKSHLLIHVIPLALVFGVSACTQSEAPQAKTAAAPSPTPTTPPAWVELEASTGATWLEAPAVVRAAAEADGDVSASARAQVMKVHVRPGSRVERGDPVVDVSAPAWSDAAAAYRGASRRLEVHTARTAELLDLRERGLVGRAEVFAEQALVADLSSQRDRAAATLRAAGITPARSASLMGRGFVTLRAPVAGVVTEVHAHPGEIHEPSGVPFAHIRGRAEARVEVRSFQPWPDGAPATFASTEAERLELDPHPLSQVIDRSDGTHITWLAFTQPKLELQDGVRGVVHVEADEDLWRVPATAVMARGDRTLVRRRRGEATADVPVQPVSSDGERSWVRALDATQLAAGDEVAIHPAVQDEAQAEKPPAQGGAQQP